MIIYKNSKVNLSDWVWRIFFSLACYLLTYQTCKSRSRHQFDECWIITHSFKHLFTNMMLFFQKFNDWNKFCLTFHLLIQSPVASTIQSTDVPTSSASSLLVKWWFPITLFLIFSIFLRFTFYGVMNLSEEHLTPLGYSLSR